MSRTDSYKTKQKELLADTIKSMDKVFTIKDIYSKLNEEVGLTTIYRYVAPNFGFSILEFVSGTN